MGGKNDSIKASPFRWGVDTAGGPIYVHEHPRGADMIRDFGFDFVVHHYSPRREIGANLDYISRLDEWYSGNGLDWLGNLESANWAPSHVDERGRDWYNRPDGRHFFLFPEELLERLGRCERLLGLVYDEAEHMQNCRNSMARVNRPFMYDPAGRPFENAAGEFTAAAAEVAGSHARHGLKLFTEHVLPVLLHCFARAGYQPAVKILKESWSPVYIACAMGAALQYGGDLWITPDLWGEMWGGRPYPGHSIEEYRSALLLAYHLGADSVYTENLAFDHNRAGYGGLICASDRDYRVTPHGEIAQWFWREYAPAHPRPYSFRQLKPRTVVIRKPDACWGQAASWLKDELFGNPEWRSSEATESWMRLFHLLTRGTMPAFAASWHATALEWRPYQVFCPMDGVVVYDHLAGYPLLKDAEAIILAGTAVSPQTLEAVARRVSEGCVCIGLADLLPEGMGNAACGGGGLPDGRGKWVAVRDFLEPAARKHITPFLPERNFIRYRFGEHEVVLRPEGSDGNRLALDS